MTLVVVAGLLVWGAFCFLAGRASIKYEDEKARLRWDAFREKQKSDPGSSFYVEPEEGGKE